MPVEAIVKGPHDSEQHIWRLDVANTRTDPAVIKIGCKSYTVAAVQIVAGDNVSGSWAVTIKGSIDGDNALDFKREDGTVNALRTTTAPYITPPIDIRGITHLHISLSTNATSGMIAVYVVLKAVT